MAKGKPRAFQPKRRGPGHPAGVPNKRTESTNAQLAKGFPPPEPISAVDQFEKIATIFWNKAVEAQKDPARQKEADGYFEKALKAWKELAPYRHQRLSSITVSGTLSHNLTGLSDDELTFLRTVIAKTVDE